MKKIKSLLLLLAVSFSLVFTANNASALQYSLDLNNTIDGNDYGTYSDIFRITVNGFAEVDQSFGADGIFNDGDAFTEMTLLQEISYKHSIIGTEQNFDGVETANKVLYLYADGLQGVATNVTGATLATTSFDYNFTPGVGTIGMYLGDDTGTLEYTAGDLLVASFSLTAGDGAGQDGFLGGLTNAGTTRLTGEFLAATPDGVWEAAGFDLGDLVAGIKAFAELNTTNQVVDGPDVYGARYDGQGNLIGYDGFTAIVNSTGHMTVNVVPEPATMLLLGFGLLGLAGVSRKKS